MRDANALARLYAREGSLFEFRLTHARMLDFFWTG